MLKIYKGANNPIVATFSADFEDISIYLYSKAFNSAKTLKHWKYNDIQIIDNSIICPLTQTETLSFPSGDAYIEIKWLESDNYIYMAEIVDVSIIDRKDSTTFSISVEDEDEDEDEDAESESNNE